MVERKLNVKFLFIEHIIPRNHELFKQAKNSFAYQGKRVFFVGRPHATLSEHGMSVKSTVFEP